jgi:FMN phosphatase YigB (HAD superfamily)
MDTTVGGLPIKAVLFDVDGTLYHQKPLRVCMAAELAASPSWLRSVAASRRLVRVLRTYRQVHEEMRRLDGHDSPLADYQIRETASRERVGERDVRAFVGEWMLRRPLKYLRWCRRGGLVDLLQALDRQGVRLGVLSDYPAGEKLAAMGVDRFFTQVRCTTDTAVNALKPHPRGFLLACETWGLAQDEVLYVGDRPEVDGAGALAAGLQCALFAPAPGPRAKDGERRAVHVRRCQDLASLVFDSNVASGVNRTRTWRPALAGRNRQS